MYIENSNDHHICLERETFDFFHKCKEHYVSSTCSDSTFLQNILEYFDKNASEIKNVDKCLVSSSKFVCPECEFVALSHSAISDHFDSIHAMDASFSCTCGVSFERMPDFLRHYIDCPVAATDLQEPGLRKQSCTPTVIKKEAIQSEKSEDVLNENVEYVESYRHPPVVPIQGPSDDKPFGCPKCPKGFKSKSLLEQHMHLHFPPRYKCRWCNKIYRWPPVYYHHMRTCKKMLSEKTNGDILFENFKSGSSSPCDTPLLDLSCPPVLPATPPVAQLIPIMPKVEINEASVSKSSVNPMEFTCSCNTTFPDIQSYFKHVATCLHFCQVLQPKQTANVTVNNVDILSIPFVPSTEQTPRKSANKVFICNVCGKEFTSKLSLKQHVDGKHRAEGKYVCKMCGKRYRWGASFYYHRRTCMSGAIIAGVERSILPRHISQPSA